MASPATSASLLLQDARYTLGTELLPDKVPPPRYLAGLEALRTRFPHAHAHFLIELDGGDGYGLAHCLAPPVPASQRKPAAKPVGANCIVISSDSDSDADLPALPRPPSAKALGKRRAAPSRAVSSDSDDVQVAAPAPRPPLKKACPTLPRSSDSESDDAPLPNNRAHETALLDIAVRKLAGNWAKGDLSAHIVEKIRWRKESERLGADWKGLYEDLFPKAKAGGGGTPIRETPNRFEVELAKKRRKAREEEEEENEEDEAEEPSEEEVRPKKVKDKRDKAQAGRDKVAKENLTALEAARRRVKERQAAGGKKKKVAALQKNPVNALDAALEAMAEAGDGTPGLAKRHKNAPVNDMDEVEFKANAAEIAEFNAQFQNHTLDNSVTVKEAMAKLGLKDKLDKLPGMLITLLPFQVISVAWMNEREQQEKSPGGILADDMGLGKTIQAITLMNLRRSRDADIRTNLVIVPLSLLDQWQEEIRTRCTGLKTHIYHGSNKKKAKTAEDLLEFDVVITTHGAVTSQWPKPEEVRKPGILFDICWYRIFIDEAHIIRNRHTRVSKACAKLDGVYRWALTGTPIVNSLADMFPLVRFLRWKPWCDWNHFNTEIVKKQKLKPLEAAEMCEAATKQLVMRRRKTDTLEGEPLVQLLKKDQKVEELEFDLDEREVYDEAEKQAQIKICRYLKRGTIMKSMAHIFTLILRLRQVTIHPGLIAEEGTGGSIDYAAELQRAREVMGEQAVYNLRKERLQVAIVMVRAERDGRELSLNEEISSECPICTDWIDPAKGVVTPCTHRFCRECIEEVLKTPQNENLAEDGAKKLKPDERLCSVCRGVISLEKLFELDCFEPSEDQVEYELAHPESVVEKQVVSGSEAKAIVVPKARPAVIVLGDSDSDTDLPSFDEILKDVKPKVKKEDVKPDLKAIVPNSKPKGKGKGKSAVPEQKAPPAKGPPKIDLDATTAVPSSKMKRMFQLIRDWKKEDPKVKVIVISSFVSALDIAEAYLSYKGIPSVRFQGSSSSEDRKEAIAALRNDPKCTVMLLSLKAGGVGLNLTAASRVITLDLAWSEAVEMQAIDRVYRLGQKSDVIVRRLTAKDTIEERILKLQERKVFYSDGALNEGQFKGGANRNALSIPELLSLFRLGPNGEKLQKP